MTEDDGQSLHWLRKRDVINHLLSAEGLLVKEAEVTNILIEHGPGGLLLLEKEELVVADVFGTEQVRRLIEVLCEFSDESGCRPQWYEERSYGCGGLRSFFGVTGSSGAPFMKWEMVGLD